MSRYGSDKAGPFLVGGYDLLGYQTQINQKISAKIEETHTLGDSWVEVSYVGIKELEMSQEGFYDDGVGSNHEALSTMLGTTAVMCFGVEGNTTNKQFLGFDGVLESDYERILSRGDLTKAKATYKGAGKVTQGHIAHPLTTRTASGNTTGNSIDRSASNTSGADAYLQVTAFTAGGSATALVIDIMHSADNLTFSSWGSFTNTTFAPRAEVKSSTAKIERYRAVKWNGNTSFPASVTFFVGIAGK